MQISLSGRSTEFFVYCIKFHFQTDRLSFLGRVEEVMIQVEASPTLKKSYIKNKLLPKVRKKQYFIINRVLFANIIETN